MGCFFFNDTATTEIYTLSLHDALPILSACLGPGARLPVCMQGLWGREAGCGQGQARHYWASGSGEAGQRATRSEEHTSALQSRQYLVCRLLLEKNTTQPLPLSTPDGRR